MKKWLLRIAKVLGVIVALYLIVALFAPSSYNVERKKTMTASAEIIYQQIAVFENWDAWSPWTEKDPSIVNTRDGEQGIVGSKTSWVGDPDLSGTGSMTMTELVEFSKIAYDLHFADMDMTSQGGFNLTETEEGTEVTWYDGADIGFLFRPLVMFFDIEGKIGPDFERGLVKLDSISTLKQAEFDASTYEIKTIDFPETKYYGVKKEIPFSEVDSTLYGTTYGQLGMFCGTNQIEMTGVPVSICFEWNEETEIADIMPAFPVADNSIDGDSIITAYSIPTGKALVVDYYGPYEDTYNAHMQLDTYVKENGLEVIVVIEEFITDPTTVESMDEVLTRIYYILN